MTRRTDLVWYAAYGSNLLSGRFHTYLAGGPVPHSAGCSETGARDRRPPLAVAGAEVPHRLYFAGRSRRWNGGGVAFLDPEPSTGQVTRCLLRLVTGDQFADVFAQENRLDHAPVLDPVGGTTVSAPGGYRRVVPLGPGPDGHPVATFTTADAVNPARPADPTYLVVVGLGLMEAFGLDPTAAATYLAERDGNRGVVDPAVLAGRLASSHRGGPWS